MDSEQIAVAVIDALEALGVPYMLVGSLSSNFYGIDRSTHDADAVVQFGDLTAADVARRLGPAYRLDPQLAFETVTGTAKHLFVQTKGRFRIELFDLSDDPHDQLRFQRRQRVQLPNDRQTWLPTAEDVIITKLRWYARARRAKDHDDIRNVIAMQADALDWDFIHHWCHEHGTRELLDSIRASIPPL